MKCLKSFTFQVTFTIQVWKVQKFNACGVPASFLAVRVQYSIFDVRYSMFKGSRVWTLGFGIWVLEFGIYRYAFGVPASFLAVTVQMCEEFEMFEMFEDLPAASRVSRFTLHSQYRFGKFKSSMPATFKVQYSIFNIRCSIFDIRCSKVQGFGPWVLGFGFWNLEFIDMPAAFLLRSSQ